jgi:hypothetical protein
MVKHEYRSKKLITFEGEVGFAFRDAGSKALDQADRMRVVRSIFGQTAQEETVTNRGGISMGNASQKERIRERERERERERDRAPRVCMPRDVVVKMVRGIPPLWAASWL